MGTDRIYSSGKMENGEKTFHPASPEPSSDAVLAATLGRKLWPHREHESNAFKSLFCNFGLHRWRQLDLRELVPHKKVDFCFWCSKVRVDGIVYDV
jgi:hypothetical protein